MLAIKYIYNIDLHCSEKKMSANHDHPHHVVKKRTIVKDRVGCVRTSTYSLPAEGHTYGAPTPEHGEGAGASKYSCRDPYCVK